jgi:hypothetical protein
VATQSSVPLPGSNLVRLVRRVGGVIAALVGLVFAVVGVFLIVSSGWASATGEVRSCRSQLVQTGTKHSSSHAQQNCVVSWEAEGRSHTATLTFTGARVAVGQQTPLKVNGDTAATPSPKWEGYVVAGVGIVLLVGGGLAIFNRRLRRPGADTLI